MQVGDLTLKPCKVVRRALCGSIRRAWEPGNPSAGKVKVGFAFVPARKQPAIDTLVPHEGGPGYSTTGTGADYAAMYGPLLDRRNLLLVDQRGTGLSRPLRCPDLQNLVIAYNVAAGKCGRSLGDRADDYTSTRSADDLAAVIAKLGLPSVSLYGDSYGTFFTQTFAGRHPELVRSIVLDSAYPTYGESAWYPTQSPAMRAAFTKACQRSPECRSAGRRFLPTLRTVLAQVRRRPWEGTAYDADGRRAEVRVDGATLTSVAFGATYAPAFYRELTAALRSGLRGYRAPLLRLVAEASRRRHLRGARQRVQRGPRRRGRLPRLPAALQHEGAARRRARAAARPSHRRADPHEPPHLQPVHRPRVRRLRLAVPRLVHPLAGGARGQPGGADPSDRAATRTCRCWC